MSNSTSLGTEAGVTDYLVQVRQPNGNLKYSRGYGEGFTPFPDNARVFRIHEDAQKLAVLKGGVVINKENEGE